MGYRIEGFRLIDTKYRAAYFIFFAVCNGFNHVNKNFLDLPIICKALLSTREYIAPSFF